MDEVNRQRGLCVHRRWLAPASCAGRFVVTDIVFVFVILGGFALLALIAKRIERL